MSFVHLHLHTEYSLLDGACRLSGIMDRAKELGQTAVAITDHGAVQAFPEARSMLTAPAAVSVRYQVLYIMQSSGCGT